MTSITDLKDERCCRFAKISCSLEVVYNSVNKQ